MISKKYIALNKKREASPFMSIGPIRFKYYNRPLGVETRRQKVETRLQKRKRLANFQSAFDVTQIDSQRSKILSYLVSSEDVASLACVSRRLKTFSDTYKNSLLGSLIELVDTEIQRVENLDDATEIQSVENLGNATENQSVENPGNASENQSIENPGNATEIQNVEDLGNATENQSVENPVNASENRTIENLDDDNESGKNEYLETLGDIKRFANNEIPPSNELLKCAIGNSVLAPILKIMFDLLPPTLIDSYFLHREFGNSNGVDVIFILINSEDQAYLDELKVEMAYLSQKAKKALFNEQVYYSEDESQEESEKPFAYVVLNRLVKNWLESEKTEGKDKDLPLEFIKYLYLQNEVKEVLAEDADGTSQLLTLAFKLDEAETESPQSAGQRQFELVNQVIQHSSSEQKKALDENLRTKINTLYRDHNQPLPVLQ
ncbi:MAG: hypothetical protein AAGI66_00555 [Cyanobacteria bacterium P01_H01_bin.74]